MATFSSIMSAQLTAAAVSANTIDGAPALSSSAAGSVRKAALCTPAWTPSHPPSHPAPPPLPPTAALTDISGTLCVEGNRPDLLSFLQIEGPPQSVEFRALGRCIDGLVSGTYQAVLTDRSVLMWIIKTYHLGAAAYSAPACRPSCCVWPIRQSPTPLLNTSQTTTPRSIPVPRGRPPGVRLPRGREDAVRCEPAHPPDAGAPPPIPLPPFFSRPAPPCTAPRLLRLTCPAPPCASSRPAVGAEARRVLQGAV